MVYVLAAAASVTSFRGIWAGIGLLLGAKGILTSCLCTEMNLPIDVIFTPKLSASLYGPGDMLSGSVKLN